MTLKRTPLYQAHVNAGAKIVEFAGFEMPVLYKGVIEEHRAVRSGCGLFDVSHMGEIEIRGKKAIEAVDWLVTNNTPALVDNQAMYAGLLYETGGFVDDLIVYRFSADHFWLVVNASNKDKDFAHMKAEVGRRFSSSDVTVTDLSDHYAQIAVQGPKAETLLQQLTSVPLSKEAVKNYWFTRGELALRKMVIARTGYTGEDGFELYVSPHDAMHVWDTLMAAGAPYGTMPIGLGARDTLRLEMKYALYGNDIDDSHTPLEAGLGWIVSFEKGDFVGRSVLEKQRANGIARKLVGFEMDERGIPRHGYNIIDDSGHVVGVVTSGTQSPSLNKAIALGYVPTASSKVGTVHLVDIRGKAARMHIAKTPFYKKD